MGPQGLGKTAMALQMLRNSVAANRSAVLFSYEHDAHSILERLIAIEAGAIAGTERVGLAKIRAGLRGAAQPRASRCASGSLTPSVAPEAVAALERYGDRLHVHTSSGMHTTLDEIRAAVTEVIEQRRPAAAGAGRLPAEGAGGRLPAARRSGSPSSSSDSRTWRSSSGCRSSRSSPPTSRSLVAGQRMRVNDLRGSSALAYEADVVLILNDKYDIVAKHHLVYHLGNAERFRHWVVMSIEKNRNGADHLELEFQKRFEQGRFEPEGRVVEEQLIEERVFQRVTACRRPALGSEACRLTSARIVRPVAGRSRCGAAASLRAVVVGQRDPPSPTSRSALATKHRRRRPAPRDTSGLPVGPGGRPARRGAAHARR